MLRNLVAAWSIPDVRARIVYVFMMIALFVVGLHIPVPGVNLTALEQLVHNTSILGLLDTFSGGALRKFTIFALGIAPYINASIIFQLLTVALPSLEAMAKEGESGRKQIAKYTRYATVGLAVVQSVGMILMLSHASPTGTPIFQGGILTQIQVVVSLTAGSCFLLWIGESITEKGIGQGVSVIIFISIMCRLPYDIHLTYEGVKGEGALGLLKVLILLAIFLGTIIGIIYVTLGTRRVPIQHAKRQMGNRQVAQQSSFLPFKVNSAGVMPIIFAISLLMFPAQIARYFENPSHPNSFATQAARFVEHWLTPGQNAFASLLYALLILAFTYFYAAITINIPELTENLKKYGSFVPGIRPGRQTQEYLDRVLTRITFAGAVFLAVIGLVQYYVPEITQIHTFSLVGGTSLLIVVGVAQDTMQNLESHLVMRNYEGFIKQSSRRRGGGGQGLSLR